MWYPIATHLWRGSPWPVKNSSLTIPLGSLDEEAMRERDSVEKRGCCSLLLTLRSFDALYTGYASWHHETVRHRRPLPPCCILQLTSQQWHRCVIVSSSSTCATRLRGQPDGACEVTGGSPSAARTLHCGLPLILGSRLERGWGSEVVGSSRQTVDVGISRHTQ